MSKSESKTIKEALKEARDHIDKKDFKSGLKCCKRALNVDKSNYMALVFYGLCSAEVEQFDQAQQAYKKATESNPDQLTAWQGFASFYEKKKESSNDDLKDLTRVYSKLLDFFKEDPPKYYGTSEKLVALSLKLNRLEDVLNALQVRIEYSESKEKSDKVYYTRIELIKVLTNASQLNEAQSKLLKKTLYSVISDDSKSIQNNEHFKLLIRHLYGQRHMQELLDVAIRMSKLFPDTAYALEWICKVYLEYVCDTLEFKSDELEEHIRDWIDKLLNLSESSTLAKLADAAYIWKRQMKYNEANEILMKVLEDSKNPNFYALYISCQCQVQLCQFAQAEESLNTALAMIPEKVKEQKAQVYLSIKVKTMLAKILYEQGKFQDINIEDSVEDPELKAIKIKTLANLGIQNKDLENEVDADTKLISQALLLKHQSEDQKAMDILNQVTDKQSFDFLLLKGQLEWNLGTYDNSQRTFLLAAKSNPKSWSPFYYLGLFYSLPNAKRDLERSRKCFQKSIQLNPSSEECGSHLSDLLRSQERHEENLSFLTSITSKGGANWAQMRLGFHYLAVDEASKAIICLQTVLRTDKNNPKVLESLADAYFQRGSYTSALKAYEKVLELRKDGLYPRLQIASIKLKLGYFLDSKTALKEILDQDPTYVPALKVMAECLLSQAREYLNECIDKNALDNCQEAIEYLVTAITNQASSQSVSFGCLWKLLGESFLLLESLPAEVAVLRVPTAFLSNTKSCSSSELTREEINKLQALKFSSKAFCRALNIQPQNVSCWQDLALSYHYRIREKDPESSELKNRAFLSLKKALALRPKDHGLWNVLGVFAAYHEDLGLAQHAFIRSITLQPHPVAWANLGLLYFMQGRTDLANKAFKEAQNQDPTFLQGWTGQAFIAETYGYEDEAMDLFRHCISLGNGLEASLGYGHFICKTLQVISQKQKTENALPLNEKQTSSHSQYIVEKMYGVSVAVDSLTRYVERVTKDPCALNMLGVLYERQNLLKSSKKMLTKSLKLSGAAEQNLVLANLARVLYKLGELEASMKCYQKIQSRDFESHCGLALSCWKAGKLEEAYGAYAEALQMAKSGEQRSHILAAMATIAYKFQGPEPAKTLLFQSVQQNPPSLQGILALCVLGLQQNNLTLVQASLREMDKHAENADIVAMKALVQTLQGDSEKAKILFSKALHKNPQDPELWKAMALHLLNNLQLYSSAAKCAQKSAGLCEGSSMEMMSLVGLSLADFDRTKAKKAAIKAIHCYPQNPEPWSVLLAVEEGLEQKNRILQNALLCVTNQQALHTWIQSKT